MPQDFAASTVGLSHLHLRPASGPCPKKTAALAPINYRHHAGRFAMHCDCRLIERVQARVRRDHSRKDLFQERPAPQCAISRWRMRENLRCTEAGKFDAGAIEKAAPNSCTTRLRSAFLLEPDTRAR